MKTIGLIGGMSWESTAIYYQLINQQVKAQLGGLHSAKVVLFSVDFAQIEQFQRTQQWDQAAQVLIHAARMLEHAGADFFLICTNTMHKLADQIQQAVNIPLVHIAHATGQAISQDGLSKVGLLGTAFTMEQSFYAEQMQLQGIEICVPHQADRQRVHEVIYQELCLGNVTPEAHHDYLKIIDQLVQQGAQGIILGCTEITMLVKPKDTLVALYDSTQLHALRAVELALS